MKANLTLVRMAYEVLINYLCVFHREERVVSHGGVCCSRERRDVLYSTGRRRPRVLEPDARGVRRPPALARPLASRRPYLLPPLPRSLTTRRASI